MPTNNYNLNTPAEGTTDWHVPLNENFESIDSLLHQLETDGSIDSGGVRHATDFSGANGGEMIQAAIDHLPASGGVVVVGSEGPDDGSNVTGTSKSGIYSYPAGDVPEVPSNTTLILYGATLAVRDGQDSVIIRNASARSGDSARDQNIQIIGFGDAVLHGNGSNQVTLSGGGASHPFRTGIEIHKVDNLTLRSFTVRDANGYHVRPENVSNVYAENITVDSTDVPKNQDGFHLIGPAKNVVLNGLFGWTGDDTTIWNGRKGADIRLGDGGTVENVHFTNVKASHADGSHRAIQILADDTAGGVRNCVASNYSGDGSVNKITKPNGTGSVNNIQNISIRDSHFESGTADFAFKGGIDITFDNVSRSGRAFVNVSGGVAIYGLNIQNCKNTMGNDNGMGCILDVDDAAVEHVRLHNNRVDGELNKKYDVPIMRITGNATVRNLTAIGNHLRGAPTDNTPEAFVIQSGAEVSNLRFADNCFSNVQNPYKFNVPRAGEVFINGNTKSALGGSSPNARLYQEGDIVEDTDNAGTAYMILDSTVEDGATQIATKS